MRGGDCLGQAWVFAVDSKIAHCHLSEETYGTFRRDSPRNRQVELSGGKRERFGLLTFGRPVRLPGASLGVSSREPARSDPCCPPDVPPDLSSVRARESNVHGQTR